MRVRKDNVIYSLDKYAKIVLDVPKLKLMLLDIQGDYDEIPFQSEDELLRAYDTLIHLFERREEPGLVHLDNKQIRDFAREARISREQASQEEEARSEMREAIDREVTESLSGLGAQAWQPTESDELISRYREGPPLGVDRDSWLRACQEGAAIRINPEQVRVETRPSSGSSGTADLRFATRPFEQTTIARNDIFDGVHINDQFYDAIIERMQDRGGIRTLPGYQTMMNVVNMNIGSRITEFNTTGACHELRHQVEDNHRQIERVMETIREQLSFLLRENMMLKQQVQALNGLHQPGAIITPGNVPRQEGEAYLTSNGFTSASSSTSSLDDLFR